jgi:hypothetical protein
LQDVLQQSVDVAQPPPLGLQQKVEPPSGLGLQFVLQQSVGSTHPPPLGVQQVIPPSGHIRPASQGLSQLTVLPQLFVAVPLH